MASFFFNNYHEELGKGTIDYTADSFKVALVTVAPNQDTMAFYSDLTNEASSSGTNYTAGGNAVASVTWTQDNTNNRAVLDFADVTFSNVTLTGVVGYVLYKTTGVASTSPLIAFIEFTEGAQSTVSNDFIIQVNASGVLTNG